jgi:predicted enzyme related to lactoylglutathione lyase
MIEPALIEFPADDPQRAQRFWSGLLGRALDTRVAAEGEGWQTRGAGIQVGVHARGRGPGDTVSLPYFRVGDMEHALDQVTALGGSIVHPGRRWSICRDCEGNPFGLALEGDGAPSG